MRPQSLDDYVGQAHLVGGGGVFRRFLETGNVPSFILWGPPGVGKTTLARLVATALDRKFFTLSAVNSGVKDVGRLGATSLYGALTPIREEEARPGDIIFFQNTLGEGVEGNDGITHCGIYVGDGMMIHCGSPISYADLSRSYWQEHFYGYARAY